MGAEEKPFVFKTRAEQRVEWLTSLGRPLNKSEVAELQKSLHAIYCRDRKRRFLAAHEREEAALLAKVQAEASQPDPGAWER